MTAREDIFQNLKKGSAGNYPPRVKVPELRENTLDRTQLIAQFIERLQAQTAAVFQVKNKSEALDALATIVKEEKISCLIAATDSIVAAMGFETWAKDQGITIKNRGDFPDRESYKDGVFTRADAGLTGADYGIAESGTLALVHDRDQPRLISLAPMIHIALMPVERVVPVLESVISGVQKKGSMPSQISLITGPSMTSDIQGRSFRGMHGPRKLFVILIDEDV